MKIDITIEGKTRKVSFTKPQARIMERLLRGEKVEMVNTHRMNGGDFIWVSKYDYEFVGYRAFWGAMKAIRDAFGFGDHEYSFSEQYFNN